MLRRPTPAKTDAISRRSPPHHHIIIIVSSSSSSELVYAAGSGRDVSAWRAVVRPMTGNFQPTTTTTSYIDSGRLCRRRRRRIWLGRRASKSSCCVARSFVADCSTHVVSRCAVRPSVCQPAACVKQETTRAEVAMNEWMDACTSSSTTRLVASRHETEAYAVPCRSRRHAPRQGSRFFEENSVVNCSPWNVRVSTQIIWNWANSM